MCPPHAVVPSGSYSTDTWGRCSNCDAWVWTTDDNGKFQYRNDWVLDAALAEAAFSRGDVKAAAKLLVQHDLPYGPVWETPSALVEMLRAITPTANDRARSEALDAVPPKGRWELAAKLLRETASSAPPAASELVFAMDLRFPGRELGEGYEVGDAFVVFEPTEMIRIDRKTGPSSVALPGRPDFLARTRDVLLFESGRRIFRMGGALDSIAIDRDYVVRPADDGWWIFDPKGDLRGVELRRPDLQPRVKITMRGYPIARRMGDGWVLSQCVDDDGRDQALTLFDASFRSVAFTEGVRGSRSIAVIDDRTLWCETIDAPFVLERWERKDRELVRTFDLPVQSWIRTTGGIVVAPRSLEAQLSVYDDRGERRFEIERTRAGATYFCKTKGGVLVYDDTSAEVIEPDTGERIVPWFRVDSPSVLGASDGTVFMRTENVLFTIGEGEPVRLFVGESMRLETTCGDAAVLRDDRGACLVVGADGQPRARFEAPNARFSVVGTRRGPYVLERGRVRLV
jgi:hypothetical protein